VRTARPAPRPIGRPKPAAKVVGRIGPAPAPAPIEPAGLDELDGADDDFLDGLEGQLEALESEGGPAPDVEASS